MSQKTRIVVQPVWDEEADDRRQDFIDRRTAGARELRREEWSDHQFKDGVVVHYTNGAVLFYAHTSEVVALAESDALDSPFEKLEIDRL